MFDDELRAPAPAPRAEEGPHRALYLRWRPKRFQDVVGQEHVTRTLRNASQLAVGSGTRTSLPGRAARARPAWRASCSGPRTATTWSTATRATCVRRASAALDGRSLDLVEIDAASNRGIDDIRDLRDKVAYRPSDGRYRRLHPRRGARVHHAGLGRLPEDARGAAGARHLRAGHDRGPQGAGDDRLALPALRLPPHPASTPRASS